MASKFDVFYVIAARGEMRATDIVAALNKPKTEYKAVFNHILELEKEGYIKREGRIKILHTKKSERLFELISFCIRNSMNYNLMLKPAMLGFIKKAAKKEFFTIKDIKVHPLTFKLYTDALSKYGFLLIISRKPLKSKLLRHHLFFDIAELYGEKISFYTPKKHNLLPFIEKELAKYKRAMRIKHFAILELEKKYEASFIYSSLNLEGNPLTLPETQKLILEEVIPQKHTIAHIQEVTNYKKAVDLMIEKSRRKEALNRELILDYHRLAMAAIPQAGTIRKQNVIIKNNPDFKTAGWESIEKKLGLLLKKYNDFESKKRNVPGTIRFASYFHNEFQRIHPFIDGNSRMSRLLMLHILKSHGVPLSDLPIGYFDLYLSLTKRSIKRDDEALAYLLQEIILMNLKRINLYS